jgi:hypothetical protein
MLPFINRLFKISTRRVVNEREREREILQRSISLSLVAFALFVFLSVLKGLDKEEDNNCPTTYALFDIHTHPFFLSSQKTWNLSLFSLLYFLLVLLIMKVKTDHFFGFFRLEKTLFFSTSMLFAWCMFN